MQNIFRATNNKFIGHSFTNEYEGSNDISKGAFTIYLLVEGHAKTYSRNFTRAKLHLSHKAFPIPQKVKDENATEKPL